jgi:sulfate adenylyltransferase
LQDSKFIDSLSGDKKYLIDYANLIQGLFINQKSFLKKKDFNFFLKRPYLGIPILFPNNLKIFDYVNSHKYILSQKNLLSTIYRTNKKNYNPFLNYIKHGNCFADFVIPKKKYLKTVNKIIRFNKISISRINFLHKNFKKICAFQTRNIPHLGHEKIIDFLLQKYNHIIINPIIGPKKKGDVKFEYLEKIYNFLIKSKYKKKISYIPFIANMFYAGPQEAIHHANLRYALGFKNFVIGRDHAGAENLYKANQAFNYISKYQNYLNINVVKVSGSYFCPKCKQIILKNMCEHNKLLINISGTDFRACIRKNILFKYADYKLQNLIFKIKKKIFV